MSVHAFAAAKLLGELSGWSLSNLQIQKILYLAHMFYLGRTGGLPLIEDRFEAWDYGPVNAHLYHALKIFGASPVRNVFSNVPSIPAGPERDIILEAYQSLGRVPAGRLVNATHKTGGAWSKNYKSGSKRTVIPNSDILDEYRHLDAPNRAA